MSYGQRERRSKSQTGLFAQRRPPVGETDYNSKLRRSNMVKRGSCLPFFLSSCPSQYLRTAEHGPPFFLGRLFRLPNQSMQVTRKWSPKKAIRAVVPIAPAPCWRLLPINLYRFPNRNQKECKTEGAITRRNRNNAAQQKSSETPPRPLRTCSDRHARTGVCLHGRSFRIWPHPRATDDSWQQELIGCLTLTLNTSYLTDYCLPLSALSGQHSVAFW